MAPNTVQRAVRTPDGRALAVEEAGDPGGASGDLILLARRQLRPGATGMDNDTVIRLRRVVLKLARQLNAASREEGLTPTQASVLGITTMRGPLSLAEPTEIEGINPTMLSRVIGKLDEFGLLKRLRDPDDFRAARVEVTPKGRGAYERITAQRSAVISESVSGLPGGQQAALFAALPALENLAEDLRDTVRRGRDRLRDSPRPDRPDPPVHNPERSRSLPPYRHDAVTAMSENRQPTVAPAHSVEI